MHEKHGGIWISAQEDGAASAVFEEYIASVDKLHVIFQRADGNYQPCSYLKQKDYQWRLPIWSRENEKAIMPTLRSAKEYLLNYGAINT
jgi:hypothetical protein